jgi:hypothetical protein
MVVDEVALEIFVSRAPQPFKKTARTLAQASVRTSRENRERRIAISSFLPVRPETPPHDRLNGNTGANSRTGLIAAKLMTINVL